MKQLKHNNNLPPARHEAGKPQVIVFDGMNLAHTAFHSYKMLSNKGRSVSMIFGVPNMIKSILTQNCWSLDKIVVAWDGIKLSKRRMKWVPGYKQHRQKARTDNPQARQEFLDQVKVLRKMLYYMGIPQAWDKSLEGDDMIYHVVKRFQKLARVTVVSGDKDMLQLCNRDVQVYNLRTKEVNTPELIPAHNWGVQLNQLVDFYALVGDSSDDIPGYRGIGPERASQFLRKFNSVESYLSNKKAEFSGLTDREKLKEIHQRNRKMMDLKWYNDKFHPDYEIEWYREKSSPRFRESNYLSLCAEYGLKTMLNKQFIDWIKSL